MSLLRRAVSEIDACAPFFLKSSRQSASGSACPQNEHTGTGKRRAATLRHIRHKAFAVGGIAQDAIAVENKGIDSLALARTRSNFVAILIGIHLEGMRHVGTLGVILAGQNRHAFDKAAGLEITSLVAHLDVKLRGKHLVDFWRQRMLNRMTDHKIFIHTILPQVANLTGTANRESFT